MRYLLFLLLSFSISIQAQDPLEAMLSAPYSSDLVKSENGKWLAWVTNTVGIRDIHVYQVDSTESQKVFSTGGDNGQVIGNLKFDEASSKLFFNLGSGPNRRSEAANPLSAAQYPNRILLGIDLIQYTIDTFGQHGNFYPVPNSQYVLLPKGNSLWELDTDTKKTKELITMRGSFTDITLHPSNYEILFSSQRGDHSFVGRYQKNDSKIEWLSPSVYHDRYPQYSPDGSKVVFLRIPGEGKGYKRDITDGYEFQIVVYNLSMGIEEVIWKSPNDAGGFAQYYHAHPLRWTKSGHILFYAETEGYMKIYTIDADGGNLVSVIDGPCEVEHSDVSPNGDQLIFSSNCGDIDRRDLFKYDLGSRTSTALTSTSSIETDPVMLSEDAFAYRFGDERTPTHVLLKNGTTKHLSAQVNEHFPKSTFVDPKQAIFQSSDGYTIHGQLFDNGVGDDKPALIFMHGGPIRQMLLGYHYSSYYANAYAFNQYMANQGYVVLSVNFRAGIGYGKDFRRAPNQGPRGAAEYQDILAGASYLKSLPNADGDRIGLWGGSYGGYLTAMGLAKNSNIFKAGVDLHGVHDWSWRATDFSDGGAWGITEELMDEALKSSPVSYMDTWTSPVLLVHGDDDRNVMFGQTIDLAQRLEERNVDYEVLVLPDEVHGFYRWESWVTTFRAAKDFFDRKL